MAVIDHAGIALDQSLKAMEWDGIPFD